ncbi:hypothetical protein EDD11_001497 [Mortierella claussenii]|nr:hypothetical protein EDD11_001497 [Mortierella claussenii]
MASQQRPASPPLPPLPTSASASSSPALSSSSSGTFKPQPIFIAHGNNTLHPPSQSSPRRGSIAAHLMSFASRSTTSLHLSSSAPAQTNASLQDESRSQAMPVRSSPFSNPFKKLQNTFHSSSSKKSHTLDSSNPAAMNSEKTERVASSSSSVNSMVSWRSKGAEMLSKKHWGRARKNSEPTFGAKGLTESPIFGASLDDAVRMSHIPNTPMVPAVLFRCAEYLEVKGVDEVGLYRVPGSHANVQKLKKNFDSGKDYNLLAMEGIDPNDIATLLKLYLRELPTPLLPAVFLEQFQSVISTDRQVCHNLRGILIRLPRSNYVVLSFLCHHLSRIAAHAEKTKMNVSNLGVVFAPTLSIGSILFKALLGGYYDVADTPENREQGLKIVWGGLLQEFDYGVQPEWIDSPPGHVAQSSIGNLSFQSTPQLPLTPAQEIVNATSLAIPAIIVPPAAPSGLVLSQSMPNEHQFSPLGTAAEEDESKLMATMLLREELAAKRVHDLDDETSSNASSSSDSIPCTDTTALSAVSSPGLSAKEHAFEASFTSPSMAFSPTMTATATPPTTTSSTASTGNDIFSPPSSSSSSSSSAIPIIVQTTTPTSPLASPSLSAASTADIATTPTTTAAAATAAASTYPAPPTINITIDAGSLLSTSTSSTSEEKAIKDVSLEEPTTLMPEKESLVAVEFDHTSASGAPQLPPLEGLMIAL